MTQTSTLVPDPMAEAPHLVDIEALPAPLLLVEGDLIVGANAAVRDLLRAPSPDSLTGAALDHIVALPGPVPTVSASTSDAPEEWRAGQATRFDGSTIEVLVRVSDGTGAAVPTVIALAPVDTARAALAEAEVRASTHNQIVRLFANLAHEMRTPLNAVIGFGQILSGKHFGPLNDKYSDYADDIVWAGQHLLGLVNGALDLGRASAGPESLAERTVELQALLESALSLVGPNADRKSIGITLPDATALPVILADEMQLRQVLINLLNNAIKYTPARRRIGVTYQRTDDALGITVWDNGPGMTPEEVKIAMLPFGRTETAMQGGEAGTGLGLPICKAIVEAHDG